MESKQQVPWKYREQVVTPEIIPVWAVSFIYCITNKKAIDEETGKHYRKIYIGRKMLNTSNRKKIGVREKAATKTRKKFKTVVKDSDWANYWGSCEELKKDRELLGDDAFDRDIIEWCHSKKYTGYAEVKHQILNDVLSNTTYNGNINSRWFRKDLLKPEDNG